MGSKAESKAQRAALLAEHKLLRRRQAKLADRLDRLSARYLEMEMLCEIGEIVARRTQKVMERKAKLFEELSGLLKKMARADAGLIRHMK